MSQGSRGVFLLQAFEQAIDAAVTSSNATGRENNQHPGSSAEETIQRAAKQESNDHREAQFEAH